MWTCLRWYTQPELSSLQVQTPGAAAAAPECGAHFPIAASGGELAGKSSCDQFQVEFLPDRAFRFRRPVGTSPLRVRSAAEAYIRVAPFRLATGLHEYARVWRKYPKSTGFDQ